MNKRKPRQTYIEFDLGEEKTINSFLVNTITGEMIPSFNGEAIEVKSAKVIMQYEGENKTRILNQTPIPLNNFTRHHNVALTNFHHLLAIDTNTIDLGKNKISVSGLIRGEIEPTPKGSDLKTYLTSVFAMQNVKGKPENIAWKITIEAIQRNPSYNNNLMIGLIVDSDLGNIDNYNTKQLPICDSFFLPENVNLIYAGSGKGREEFFGNILLNLADKEASKSINEAKLHYISGQNLFPEIYAVENQPFTHLRVLMHGNIALSKHKFEFSQVK